MNRSKGSFRIIDLMVVTAVVALLTALFLPATRGAREAARRTTCANHLKQLGLGVHNYHDTFKVLPPAGTQVGGFDASRAPRLGWRVRILPFFEAGPLYNRLNMKSPRASLEIVPLPKNPQARACEHQVPYAMCPDDESDPFADLQITDADSGRRISVRYAQSSYTGNLGTQLVASGSKCDWYVTEEFDFGTKAKPLLVGNYHAKQGATNRGGFTIDEVSGVFCARMFGPLTLGDIKDGTSNTFLAGEVLGRCNRANSLGWWEDDGYGNARGQTATPLNIHTTCVSSEQEAMRRGFLHAECADEQPWKQANLSWGFRSYHPDGANFLLCDGSVQFINNDINYSIYRAYGGRDDSQPVME